MFTQKQCKRISEIMHLDKRGGKLIQRDNDTIIVVDCCKIIDVQIRAVQIELPHVSMELVSSDASLSGFCVIFYSRVTSGNIQNAHVVAVLSQVIAYLTTMWYLCRTQHVSTHTI